MTPPIAGPARSEAEIVRYVGSVAVCPACGHVGLMLSRITRAPEPGVAAVAGVYCAICRHPTEIAFTAGPGWENPREPDDPRMATGDAPSVLIPESLFRLNIDLAVRREAELEPDRHTTRHVIALGIVGDLLELAKLYRARGDHLEAPDRALLRRFADILIAAGDVLPAGAEFAIQYDSSPVPED